MSTRERLWRLAGPQRTAAELTEMLDDPYPPARMIAASALVRSESRGVHRRSDFPNRDTALDGTHTVIDGSGEARLQPWV